MNFRKRPLLLTVVAVLLVAMLLPCLCACNEEQVQTTTEEQAVTEKETESVQEEIPKVDLDNGIVDSVDSLASTPNKGGSSLIVSGTDTVESAFAKAMKKLEEDQKNADSTNATATSAKRSLAEQYMRTLLTVLWSPKEDVKYGLASATGEEYTLYSNRVYRGIPYTNGSSGLEAFKNYTEEGSTEIVLTTFGQSQLSGPNTQATIGADDIDALIYSWNKVSDTVFAHSVADMIPINGFIFLGDYIIPQLENWDGHNVVHDQNPHSGNGAPGEMSLTYDESLSKDTDDICLANGAQTMYEAYAKLKKADALICSDEEKELAYMAVSVDVQYLPEGGIDGKNSTVTLLYQTKDLFEAEETENGVYLIGQVDKKVSFEELFAGNFIPVTMAEFQDGSVQRLSFMRDSLDAATGYVAKNLYAGFITTSQRVVCANMMLLNEKGEYLFDHTTLSFQGDVKLAKENRFGFDVTKIPASLEAGRGFGDEKPIAVAELNAGTYRCILTLELIDGSTVTARDFTFVVEAK